jgi:hypothetical protein
MSHGSASLTKSPEPGRDLHKVKLTKKPPDILSCILFDASNNLRAVLDQVGYAGAVAATSQSLKAVKFPYGVCKPRSRGPEAGRGVRVLTCSVRRARS